MLCCLLLLRQTRPARQGFALSSGRMLHLEHADCGQGHLHGCLLQQVAVQGCEAKPAAGSIGKQGAEVPAPACLPVRLVPGWHALLLAISTCHRGVWRQVTQHCVLLPSKTSLAPCAKTRHSFGPAAWPCATTHAMCSTGIPGPFHGHHIKIFLSKHHLNCFSILSACLPRWQSTLTVTCELLCPTSGAPSQHLLAHLQCTLSVL